MSYLRYFLYKTNLPENFVSAIRNIRINGKKVENLHENQKYESELNYLHYELKTSIKRNEKEIEFESWIINEKRLIKNSYGKYDYEGNLLESRIYTGPESERYNSTVDDKYHSKMLCEIICCDHIKNYWDEIKLNEELPHMEISNKMCGVVVRSEKEITDYNPVKITMSSIEIYFKGKEKMLYLEHLMKKNPKVICYMLNDEEKSYKENKLNHGMSILLGVEIYGDVLLVDWNNKKISKKNYELMIKYLYNLDKKEYNESKIKEFENLMKNSGYKIEHI